METILATEDRGPEQIKEPLSWTAYDRSKNLSNLGQSPSTSSVLALAQYTRDLQRLNSSQIRTQLASSVHSYDWGDILAWFDTI